MYSFDASSMIHVWDTYPPSNPHFESLWEWIAQEISNEEFSISKTAFDEVSHKIPACGKWLNDNNIKIHPLTARSLFYSQEAKSLLGIIEEEYGKGVGENDLFIIGVAKDTQTILISEESIQSKLPLNKTAYKIPAVCDIPQVGVSCIKFLELLEQRS